MLRSAVAIVLVLAITFLIGLAVVGWSGTASDAIAPMFNHADKSVSKTAAGLTVLFILVTPTALFTFAARRRRLNWFALGLGWAAVLPVFGWLATDDNAIRRPLSIEEISPAFDGAQKSYALLMRYSKQHPSDEAKEFTKRKPALLWNSSGPSEPDKWIEYLTKNRAALATDWIALTPQRQWFAELNAFDRIGDLTPPRFDADIMRFDVWRTLSQRMCAAASQQVLDGQGDEALATILPLLEISRKLEPSSRTLIRTMIARVMQKLSLHTITFILNRSTPSAAIRPRLAAALAGGNGPAGARRMVLIEYPAFASVIPTLNLGDQELFSGEGKSPMAGPLRLLSPFLFNPIATVNIHGDRIYELAALAEAREIGKFTVRNSTPEFGRPTSPKNVGGAVVLAMAMPAMDKVVRVYWEIEDQRTALHARVVALPQ